MMVVGPFSQNDSGYRGMFLLDVPTFESAKILLKNDPALEGKFLESELFYWYGSAALPKYLETVDKIWKVKS